VLLFFSFDRVIVNMQEGCVIVGEIEDNDQQKSLLKKRIIRGKIVHFKKMCKMSLKKEAWKGENLSAFSRISWFISETIRRY
jgi:hypothetical protein